MAAGSVQLTLSSMATSPRAFGDLLAKAGFFEADLGISDFGGQASHLHLLFSLLDRGPGTFDIDVFRFFRNLGHDRHFGGRHFSKSPQDGHIVPDLLNLIPEFSDTERRKKMAMSRQYAKLAFRTGRNHHIHRLAQ